MQFFMKLSLSWSWCDVDTANTAIASAGRRDSAEAGNLKIVTSLWNLYWHTLLEKCTSCYCSGVTSLWCIQNTFVSSADVLLLHILVFFGLFKLSVSEWPIFVRGPVWVQGLQDASQKGWSGQTLQKDRNEEEREGHWGEWEFRGGLAQIYVSDISVFMNQMLIRS